MDLEARFSRASVIVGRVGLASLFVLGGLNKLLNYAATLDQMAFVGLALPQFLLPFVIVLELGGGLIVAIGGRLAPLTAYLLAGFTLMTNLVFHDFWTMDGQRAALELSLFFKNVCISGALIYFAGTILGRDLRS